MTDNPFELPQTPARRSLRFAKAALVLILTVTIAAASILMVGPQIVVITPVA